MLGADYDVFANDIVDPYDDDDNDENDIMIMTLMMLILIITMVMNSASLICTQRVPRSLILKPSNPTTRHS